MNLAKRITRRPVSTTIWLIVCMLASLILGAAASVYASAVGIPNTLEERMTTIAVPVCEERKNADGTYTVNIRDWLLFEEDVAYLKSLPQVKDLDFRYFSGAYIEELTAKIGFHMQWGMYEDISWGIGQDPNQSYRNVMLIGTVEQTFTLPFESVAHYDLTAFGGEADTKEQYHMAVFRVEDVVSMNPDYPLFPIEGSDYYDGRVNLWFQVYGNETKSYFQEGKRYAIHGSYDPACVGTGNWPVELAPMLAHVTLNAGDGFYGAFSEGDTLAMYHDIQEEQGDWYNADFEHPIITKLLSRGERIPVAMEWNGTKEELLSDSFWGQRAKEYEIAQHSFVVLGTDNLESMYSFVKNEAAIVAGRSFTKEEYETGAKVVLLDEGVAKKAELSVGDTLTVHQFRAAVTDENGNGGNASINTSLYGIRTQNNLTLGGNVFYFGMPKDEAETFTIVGLYRMENEWKDGLCSFTPNTVFMPRKAQTEEAYGGVSRQIGTMKNVGYSSDGSTFEWDDPIYDAGGVSGLFLSIILKNGTIESFQKRIEDDSEYSEFETLNDGTNRVYQKGFGGHVLLFFDQGYDAYKDSISALIASAGKLAALMAAGSALLFLMYLLLYQGTERKTIGIMRSLGATTRQTRRYLFFSGLLLAAVGFALGAVLSGMLSGMITGKLYAVTLTQDTELFRDMLSESSVPAWVYAALAAVETALAALVLWVQAAILSRKSPRKLQGK